NHRVLRERSFNLRSHIQTIHCAIYHSRIEYITLTLNVFHSVKKQFLYNVLAQDNGRPSLPVPTLTGRCLNGAPVVSRSSEFLGQPAPDVHARNWSAHARHRYALPTSPEPHAHLQSLKSAFYKCRTDVHADYYRNGLPDVYFFRSVQTVYPWPACP